MVRKHLPLLRRPGEGTGLLALGDDRWHSIQPMDVSAGQPGSNVDVTRLAALWVDFDCYSGKATAKGIKAVIKDLAAMLGTAPAYIVTTGGGYQPYWLLDDPRFEDLRTDQDNHVYATVTLARWKEMVRRVADAHDIHVDALFDLARKARTPGFRNSGLKGGKRQHAGGDVTVKAYPHQALSADVLEEVFLSYGIEDAAVASRSVTDVEWAEGKTCRFWKKASSWFSTWTPKDGVGRHQWAQAQVPSVLAAARKGCLSQNDLVATLGVIQDRLTELRDGGSDATEVHRLVIWAVPLVDAMDEAKLREEAKCDCTGLEHAPVLAEPAQAPAVHENEMDFWNAHPVLRHIYDGSRAGASHPWAVLAITMARFASAVPPGVSMNLGWRGNLNTYVILAGPPSAGKDSAVSLSKDLVVIPGEPIHLAPGTPEGILKYFAETTEITFGEGEDAVTEHVQKNTNGFFKFSEGSVMRSRSGEAMEQILAGGWTGDMDGKLNAGESYYVAPNSFRCCLAINLQPELSTHFLSKSAMGFPQRFLAVALNGYKFPSYLEAGAPLPPAMTLKVPAMATDGFMMPVCQEAIAVNAEARRKSLENPEALDIFDSHGPYKQAKVAGVLALMFGHTEVTRTCWDLASIICARSQEALQWMLDSAKDAQTVERASHYEVESDAQALPKQVVSKILTLAEDWDDSFTASEMQARFTRSQRGLVKTTLTRLVAVGKLDETRCGRGMRYALARAA